jgi:diacylglycerol kinase (ATP)
MKHLKPLPPPDDLPEPPRSRAQLGFFGSFRHAWHGLLHSLRQRNMKFHLVSAVMVGLVGSGIRLGLAEKVTLIFCVMLVFFAEILNTALEALVDLHTEDFRELAKTTKDAAAAGVLVLALGTVVIFAALLVHNWHEIAGNGPQILRQATVGGPLTILAGLLVSRFPKPAWVKHAMFAAGLLLWGALWLWTTSMVFTVLTGGIFFLAWQASLNQPASE